MSRAFVRLRYILMLLGLHAELWLFRLRVRVALFLRAHGPEVAAVAALALCLALYAMFMGWWLQSAWPVGR